MINGRCYWQPSISLKTKKPSSLGQYHPSTYGHYLASLTAKAYTQQPLGKKKKLDHYKDWILAWLEEYPHLSSAQIHDWLLERYPDLVVGASTVRTYVRGIREVLQIEKR